MATLLKGDCLKVMKGLPDKSVDCFICDLPYGQLTNTPHKDGTPGKSKGGKMYSAKTGCHWDIKIDLDEFWIQVKRLCKNEHTPVLMFCNTRFGFELIKSNPKWFRYDLVWDKNCGVSFLLANKQPMKSHEMIYLFSKAGPHYKRIDIDKPGAGAYNTTIQSNKTTIARHWGRMRIGGSNVEGKRCPLSVINIKGTHTRNGHPTEKPKELYHWLLKRYCPQNGMVLDPTAGSFNSVIVARELGLRAIGIEMDDDFFWTAVNKIACIS